ncbi:MAG: sugar phosphate isomerase/epimerase family protein [Verrucomicrobiota bacterium]|jgi:sugar phosphate isomerase/epimerase|nr:sugar phosphate isomerase/epimerase family protein [Verrucomicrobiota bacterium]
MKFAICNEVFEGWSIDDSIRFVAETGYDAIEIAPFTLAQYVTEIPIAERQRIRRIAEDNGIEVSAIHWVLIKTEGLYMTHTDEAVREKTSDYFCELVDCCADLGGKAIVVGSPKLRNLLPGVSFEQAWELARETFAKSIKRAEEKGVTICFEPLAPSETDFINTAEQAIEFVSQFDSDAFKIILDVKAMSSEAKPIPEIIRDSHPNFAYFHCNDANLKGPGFGDVDFKPIFGALKEVGYGGVASVEVFDFEEGPETIARESLRYMREASA